MQHRRSSLILAGALPILFLASACSDSPSTSTTPENEKSALGTACAEADECNSGFCGPVLESDTTVCAECVEDEDCTEADASCEWNSTGEYFSCEAADFPGLSDSCTSGDDCDSGFCYETAADSFCSLCEVAGDCGVQRDCVFYARDSYAVCEGTGILGATCESSDQCISDACAVEVCSECATSEDCGEGGSCVEDTDLGYHVCEGGLGNSCETAEECDSGVCYDTGDGSVCSECEIASVCGVLRDCAYDSSLGYAACVGTAELGDNCDNADQCVSLFCTDGNCAECGTSEDCDGTSCIDDPNGGGYSVCTGAIADPCTISEECDSGFCFERNPSQIRCSECESIGDCSTQQDCLWVRGDGYADCLGTGDLGASCVAGDQCVSAFCNSDICSECDVNEDCPLSGECKEDADSGYHVCSGGLGESCAASEDCTTTFCYDTDSDAGLLCSECVETADCGASRDCFYEAGDAYATCAGIAELGTGCADDGQCASDICSDGVCSECTGTADCGGAECLNATSDTTYGYYLCADTALGDVCAGDLECESSYCFATGEAVGDVCSECNAAGDCGEKEECTYDSSVEWGVCMGTVDLGGVCATDEQCISGMCNELVCSECLQNDRGCVADTEACTYDDGLEYSVCKLALGQNCTAADGGSECASGYCYNRTTVSDRCSECTESTGCADGETCEMPISIGPGDTTVYAVCE